MRKSASSRSVGKMDYEPAPNVKAMNESDTNADTCCLGTNFIPISFTNRTADVYPYDTSYAPVQNVPIVSGATAYDAPDGKTYILIFHESLFYGTKLPHSLINPNKIRHVELEFWDNPFDDNHELGIEASEQLSIPMKYTGTKLSFETRVPTSKELSYCEHIELTDDAPWEPHTVKLGLVHSENTSYQVQQLTSISLADNDY